MVEGALSRGAIASHEAVGESKDRAEKHFDSPVKPFIV